MFDVLIRHFLLVINCYAPLPCHFLFLSFLLCKLINPFFSYLHHDSYGFIFFKKLFFCLETRCTTNPSKRLKPVIGWFYTYGLSHRLQAINGNTLHPPATRRQKTARNCTHGTFVRLHRLSFIFFPVRMQLHFLIFLAHSMLICHSSICLGSFPSCWWRLAPFIWHTVRFRRETLLLWLHIR